eukprot:8350048-Alexandrium_andersonii.AAC.1
MCIRDRTEPSTSLMIRRGAQGPLESSTGPPGPQESSKKVSGARWGLEPELARALESSGDVLPVQGRAGRAAPKV